MGKTACRLILFDATSDLAGQLVVFSLLDGLVFQHHQGAFNLLMLCLIQQAPAIFLSPMAGRGVDRWGARQWMLSLSLVKCLFVGCLWTAGGRMGLLVGYVCFIVTGVFTHIGQLSAVTGWLPSHRIIGFNALNERVGLGLRVAGPVIIGWGVHHGGSAIAFGTAVVLMLIGAVSIRAWHGKKKWPDRPMTSSHTGKGFFFRAWVFKAIAFSSIYAPVCPGAGGGRGLWVWASPVDETQAGHRHCRMGTDHGRHPGRFFYSHFDVAPVARFPGSPEMPGCCLFPRGTYYPPSSLLTGTVRYSFHCACRMCHDIASYLPGESTPAPCPPRHRRWYHGRCDHLQGCLSSCRYADERRYRRPWQPGDTHDRDRFDDGNRRVIAFRPFIGNIHA